MAQTLHAENSRSNAILSKKRQKRKLKWACRVREKIKARVITYIWGLLVLTNKEVLEKLKDLGVEISERTLQDWIKKGLGPKPVRKSTGTGTYTDHHPEAYAEFYATARCIKGKAKKQAAMYRWAVHYLWHRGEFLDYRVLPSFIDDDVLQKWFTANFKELSNAVPSFILLRFKALNNIPDGKFFEVVYELGVENPLNVIYPHPIEEKGGNELVNIMAGLSKDGVRNVACLTLKYPQEYEVCNSRQLIMLY